MLFTFLNAHPNGIGQMQHKIIAEMKESNEKQPNQWN